MKEEKLVAESTEHHNWLWFDFTTTSHTKNCQRDYKAAIKIQTRLECPVISIK